MNGSGHQRRISYRLLLMVLWATLLVFAIELTAGWVSHSLCLLAESLHTLIDVFSALLGLVAVASPQRTLGKEIWGYGRGEATGALILSGVLGFASISLMTIAFSQLDEAFFESARGVFQVEVTGPLVVLIWVMVALMAAVAGAAAYQSRSINSLALKLTAQHILADAWLTGLVLIGLMAIAQGYQWIDPILSMLLVVMSVRSLWQVLHSQLPMLLKPTAIAPEAIAQIACQVEGVTRCTRILSRGMVGRQVWIELHLALHPEFMVIAHTIGERVERSLRDHYGPVRAQIWMDQVHPKDRL
jgi:cation diffusion facilitator family transporter